MDEFPLRRASTLNLLRTHLCREGRAFASVAELLPHLTGDSYRPSCVIVSVGENSVTGTPLSDDLKRLAGALASIPLIILSDRDEPGEVAAAIQRGARGYIPTSLDPRLAIGAVRVVLAGNTYVPVEALIHSRRKAPDAAEPSLAPTTVNGENWLPRQVAVLRLLVQGKGNREIALALKMEECKVKVCVGTIMRKLGATNRTQAAILACRLGLFMGANPAFRSPV